MRIKIFGLVVIFIALTTTGFGCKWVDKEVQEKMKPITLKYWRVFDGPEAFDQIIENYKALHPFVKIEYRKFRYNEYEKELIDAFAEDRAPDIFSIHNTWIRKYQTKISPLPKETSMVYPVVKGSIKKEIVPELRTTKSLTIKELKDTFADAVSGDVVLKSKDAKTGAVSETIYGLPLSVDTLALYYNRDLFDNAGIVKPPSFWNAEFQQHVKKLTKQDRNGLIVQSGVALGGSGNIERYSDILSVLMMQNGSEMVDGEKVVFHLIPQAYALQRKNPGLEALRFYTDFSNPEKEVYSWNSKMDNSLELFIQGRLAMFFGYAYHLPTINGKTEKLNFSVTSLPQVENSQKNINFANYWVETVSFKSKNKDAAWDFIQFATKAEQVKTYLKKTQKPTALKELVPEQSEDEDIGVFAEQVLTAKSWYKGYDPLIAEQAIGEMIEASASGTMAMEKLIEIGAKKVEQTNRKQYYE